MSCLIEALEVIEGSSVVLLARVTNNEDENITQADISSISFSSTLDGTVVTGPTSLDKTQVIYDTLQTGNGWKKDKLGYNFKFEPSVSAYPEGSEEYLLCITLTPVSGQPIVLLWSVTTLETGI